MFTLYLCIQMAQGFFKLIHEKRNIYYVFQFTKLAMLKIILMTLNGILKNYVFAVNVIQIQDNMTFTNTNIGQTIPHYESSNHYVSPYL